MFVVSFVKCPSHPFIFIDGCVERFDFVDGLQTRRTDGLQTRLAGYRRAAVRPEHGRILVLLLGDVRMLFQ